MKAAEADLVTTVGSLRCAGIVGNERGHLIKEPNSPPDPKKEGG
jgi:hypothetical protein